MLYDCCCVQIKTWETAAGKDFTCCTLCVLSVLLGLTLLCSVLKRRWCRLDSFVSWAGRVLRHPPKSSVGALEPVWDDTTTWGQWGWRWDIRHTSRVTVSFLGRILWCWMAVQSCLEVLLWSDCPKPDWAWRQGWWFLRCVLPVISCMYYVHSFVCAEFILDCWYILWKWNNFHFSKRQEQKE